MWAARTGRDRVVAADGATDMATAMWTNE